MAVISIFSGSFCGGEEVADAVTRRLGYERIDQELIEAASRRYEVPKEKLLRVMMGSAPLLNRFTYEREKNLAYIKAALAELVSRDNVVYHGFAGHLLPPAITHCLKVCIIANMDYRVALAMKQETIPESQALNRIHKEDADRGRWTRYLFGYDPYDEGRYDMLIAMHLTSVEAAADMICDNARKEPLRATPQSLRAARDFILAAQVNIALAEKGHDVDVTSSAGEVTIWLKKYTPRLERLSSQLTKIAQELPGVAAVQCKPGEKFIPPSLIVSSEDFELPTRILLVDDEREFVHTLSERLQTRKLESTVVYDGEEALSFVAGDEPEVMVLDLKMPGIDGLEVLRRMKKEHPAVEVIILTGHGSEREEQIARELGAFAYLHKPVDIDVLADTMKSAYRKLGKKPPVQS
jgi:CheY-like chemotaxis protein